MGTTQVQAIEPALLDRIKTGIYSMGEVVSALWIRQIIIVAMLLVSALAGFLALSRTQGVVQTIGKDSVPSIVAAEQIRVTLADANTDFLNVFLNREAANGPSMQAYRKAMDQAHDALLTASQNITYGQEERQPILNAMQALGIYEGLVGKAVADGRYTDTVEAADRLMQKEILPAVVALDGANFQHMAEAYETGRHDAKSIALAMVFACGLTGAALVATQLYLFKRFNRVFNIPLLIATVALVVVGAWVFTATSNVLFRDMKTAKEDAFDSVHALSQALAVGYEANAAESMYLLQTGFPSAQTESTARFQRQAAQIYIGPDLLVSGMLNSADGKTLAHQGLLGDEMANITFEGEDQAARATLGAWLEYATVDRRIRALEVSGRHAEAVALCLGSKPHESDWVFEQFVKFAKQTADINQAVFDREVDLAFAHVQRAKWAFLLGMLIALVGSVVGVQVRLSEFRA